MTIRYAGQAADDAALEGVGLASITQWTDVLADAALSGDTARTETVWQAAILEYGRTHDGYIPADGRHRRLRRGVRDRGAPVDDGRLPADPLTDSGPPQ
jgi:hypothetical protein